MPRSQASSASGSSSSSVDVATRLGLFRACWSDEGMTSVRLEVREADPEASAALASAPEPVRRLAELLVAYAAGAPVDFRDVRLDARVATGFELRVYELARAIPPGSTRSYGDVARAIGSPDASRAVGAALRKNPWMLVVPCHRIVGKSGALVGFTAPGGLDTKRALLALERSGASRDAHAQGPALGESGALFASLD